MKTHYLADADTHGPSETEKMGFCASTKTRLWQKSKKKTILFQLLHRQEPFTPKDLNILSVHQKPTQETITMRSPLAK